MVTCLIVPKSVILRPVKVRADCKKKLKEGRFGVIFVVVAPVRITTIGSSVQL